MSKQSRASHAVLGFWLALSVLAPASALADHDDPPTRVARLAFVSGSVSFKPGGTDQWVGAQRNRPLTSGDKLWSDRDGRVELQLDGSFLRLGNNTAVSFLNVGDRMTQVQLSAGTLVVRVRRLDGDESYEIDTPNLAFSILRPGLYRVNVDESGATTAIDVRRGEAEVTGGGSTYALREGDYETFSGTDQLIASRSVDGTRQDPVDVWSEGRDSRYDRSASLRYVSPDVVGTEDLDEYGAWRPTPGYGTVWYPHAVAANWAPYHDGHWAYIAPWGYTWVDDSPWGYAPFHYGRWISVDGAWGWVPAPPRQESVAYVRAVYAPALVAWIGAGAGIAWFALGPREVYVPSYPVSRGYVDAINVSNTTVNSTTVNNIYNTTIVNNTVNVTNVTYVNRGVPGAVVGTTAQAFASAQPVARNVVHVDERTLARADVQAFAPIAAPTKQAVLGPGQISAVKPPAVVETRVAVARTAPPPPPPPFERRQEAIRGNAGKPLSMAQDRQIQADGPAPAAAVRIAPPAKAVATPAAAPAPRMPAPGSESVGSVPAPVHPNDVPRSPPPVSPTGVSPGIEQQHLEAQQLLRARQEADRQRVQQQHDLEHRQLATQQADEAQRQQLESQHQRDTQALIQRHAQEQQQLEKRHDEERPPAQPHNNDRPPVTGNEANRPAPAAERPAPVHPNEIPRPPLPQPSSASSGLDRQHLEEQRQLLAQQQADRQRVQQQQEVDHQQLLRQQADAAQRQQVEQQHQRDTQQLMQKHAEEQRLLENHQQQQRKQQKPEEGQPPPKYRGADRPPEGRP